MSARVVVFLDWQNVYNGAREMFCTRQAPHWHGQVDPVAPAQHLADDSPFDRHLHQYVSTEASLTASLTRADTLRAAASMQTGSARP